MTTEDSAAFSAASECSDKIETMKIASDLLAQGKRNMVCGEIPKAVSLYEEAVQLLVKCCGELSRDCADAYFCCGSALLELGRMETNVLGVALQGVDVEEEKEEEGSEQFEKPPEDEGEERQKLRMDVYDAMAEGEREEEQKKSLLEKSKDSTTEGNLDICDKSQEICDMETDAVGEEKGVTENSGAKEIHSSDTPIVAEDSISTTVTNDSQKNDSSGETTASAKHEESVTRSACDDCKQEDKIDDKQEDSTEITAECSSCVASDQENEENKTLPASKDIEQTEKMDDTPAEENSSEIGKEEDSVAVSASDNHKQEEKIDENPSESVEENKSEIESCREEESLASEECNQQEKIDDSTSEDIKENSSKIESDKEEKSPAGLTNADSKQQKIDDSTSEDIKENSSKIKSDKEEESLAGSTSDDSKQQTIDDSTSESAEENNSKVENDKEKDSVAVSASNNQQENKIVDITTETVDITEGNNSAVAGSREEETMVTSVSDGSKQEERMDENAEVTGENGSATESAIQVEGLRTSENKQNKIEENGEQLVPEAVIEGCQNAAGESDVDMAENDDEDDEECVNTEDDIQESEENGVSEKEEDVPNFQLAWEYLDLAKVLYLKSELVDDQLKAAECYLKLGELSMETEQYTVAAEDLGNALKIQEKYLPANDRLIAETNYQLGLAYGFGGEYERSIQNYTTAIGVIESKIESLNQLVKDSGVDGENKENLEVDQLKKYQNEIKELQELIPEIKIKIEDIKQEAADVERMKQMAEPDLNFADTLKETDASTKTVTADSGSALDDPEKQKASDIGHLVRKKRKPDSDLSDDDDLEVKKIRPDGDSCVKSEAVNGASGPDTNITDEGCSVKVHEDDAVSADPVES